MIPAVTNPARPGTYYTELTLYEGAIASGAKRHQTAEITVTAIQLPTANNTLMPLHYDINAYTVYFLKLVTPETIPQGYSGVDFRTDTSEIRLDFPQTASGNTLFEAALGTATAVGLTIPCYGIKSVTRESSP